MFNLFYNLFLYRLVDIYPFKFEIQKTLLDYFMEKEITDHNHYILSKILRYSEFAFQLMFLKYKDKQTIINFIKKENIYQNINYNPESIEYLESLPPIINIINMLDKDSIGYNSNEFNDLYEMFSLHQTVINNIKKNYPKYRVIIYN